MFLTPLTYLKHTPFSPGSLEVYHMLLGLSELLLLTKQIDSGLCTNKWELWQTVRWKRKFGRRQLKLLLEPMHRIDGALLKIA